MNSQAYVDESGGDDTKSFVLGGYFATTKAWTGFADAWQEILDDYSIAELHMHKCESGREDGFERLSVATREEMCIRLADLVVSTDLWCIWVELKSSDWDDLVRSKITDRTRIPKPTSERILAWQYGWSALTLMVGMAKWLPLQTSRIFGTVESIFDWRQDHHRQCKDIVENELIPLLVPRSVWWPENTGTQLASPKWPMPHERRKYVPLQAADLWVWHRRRALDEVDGANRRVYKTLFEPLLAKRRLSCIELTRERLEHDSTHRRLAQFLNKWADKTDV